jgi:hypothetical protein
MLPGMNGFQKPARDSNPESPDDSVDMMALKAISNYINSESTDYSSIWQFHDTIHYKVNS